MDHRRGDRGDSRGVHRQGLHRRDEEEIARQPGYPLPSQPLPGAGAGSGGAYPQGGPAPYAPAGPQQPFAPYGQRPYEYPPLTPDKPPKPPKRKRGVLSRILFWLLVIVLVLALSFLGYIMVTYWQGQRAYDDVAQHAQTSTDELAAFEVDWAALRAINPDVVAWIYVPGTNINYPVCWRKDDSEYYLRHNFNGETSPQFGAEYGCPALSGANNPDLTDDINIISGHNLINGEMFSAFSTFNDSAVFNEHRIIYLLTPDANYRLKTFAVDYVSGYGSVPIRFSSKAEMHEFVQQCIDDTLVDADPPPPAADTIDRAFAFYTCDNSNDSFRFFIYAYVDEYLPVSDLAKALAGQESSHANVDAVNDASQERAQ